MLAAAPVDQFSAWLADAVAAGRPELDIGELGRGTGQQGTPIPALLESLRSQLSGAAAASLHKGATSQDVLDTAIMLWRALRMVRIAEFKRKQAAPVLKVTSRAFGTGWRMPIVRGE